MTRLHRVRPSAVPRSWIGRLPFVLGVLAAVPVALSAQVSPPAWDAGAMDGRDWGDDVPAHVALAEGEAWLEREHTIDGAPTGVPLLAGDRLRSERGRLEVLFADGSVLSLDEFTDAELLADDLLRLNRGTIRVDLSRQAGAAGYRVDAAGTTSWLRAAGEYRLDLSDRGTSPPDIRLLVVRGQAELSANGQRTLVRAGYEAFASSATTPSLPYAVTVTRWDSFDRWWDDRRSLHVGAVSAQYLPPEVGYYGGVMDRDGDWRYENSYGYVWYPRVATTWSPYSAGRWSFVGAFGWVWIGNHRWAWPTHHYGRWGHSGGRYFWIPGRAWAPAWVAWASSPSYIGWAPLGFDNGPLVSISVAYGSGWRGWSHAPARSFSAGIVFANRSRYAPPRNVAFSPRIAAPDRPVRAPGGQPPGIRGPGRSTTGTSVAMPRSLPARSATRSVIIGRERQPQTPSVGRRSETGPVAVPRAAPATRERTAASPPRSSSSVRGATVDRVAPPPGAAPTPRTVIQPSVPRRTTPTTGAPVARPRTVPSPAARPGTPNVRRPLPSAPAAPETGTSRARPPVQRPSPSMRAAPNVERPRTGGVRAPSGTNRPAAAAPAQRSPTERSPSPRAATPTRAPRQAPASPSGSRASARPRG